jgi:hypothetical protein
MLFSNVKIFECRWQRLHDWFIARSEVFVEAADRNAPLSHHIGDHCLLVPLGMPCQFQSCVLIVVICIRRERMLLPRSTGSAMTWSLTFFTPPLLGDKLSGNLQFSLLGRRRLVYFFASDEAGGIRCLAFSIDDRHARLIGHLLRYHQIGTHESQHPSRVERQPDNPGIVARTKDLRE